MRKNKFKKYVFLLIIPLLFITGISSWIILNNTVFAPSYNPNSTSILFQAFDGQSGTYTKESQGPVSSNDKIKNENVSFSYRKAESNDFYTEGLPINAGTYDILIKDNSKYYVDEVVRYTINKATPICDVTPELSEIYEGEIPTIVNKGLLVFTGINSEEVVGNLSIDPNINYPENSTNTSEKVTVNVNFTSSNPNYSDAVIYGTVDMPAIAYIIGSPNIYFGSIHKAINAATSGNIVTVVPPVDDNYHSIDNAITPDKVEYDIYENCTIKENVTFIVPTDSKTLSSVKNTSSLNTYIKSLKNGASNRGDLYTYSTFANESSYKRVNININKNISLINNGTLVVSGYLSGGTSEEGLICHTSHSYSTITLDKNAKIIQDSDNAVTHCYGYIYEDEENNGSNFALNKGDFYIPYVVNDYKGFGFSWAMTDGAINTHRCSPFNQFEFCNITTKLTVNYNAQVIGVVTIRVIYQTLSVDQIFNEQVYLIGNTSTYFIQQSDSQFSSVEYKYSISSKKAKIIFYGGNKLNKFDLKLSVSTISIDLSTTNSYFPISYKFDIEFAKKEQQTRANFDITTQRIKLLPGTNFKINEGCDLNANEIIVYSAFYDGAIGNGEYSEYEGRFPYPMYSGATFKLMNNSSLVSNKLAGTIYSDNASIEYTSNTITSKEPWNTKSSGKLSPAWTVKDYLEIREKLSIQSITDYSKMKLFIGVNTFSEYSNYLPQFNIYFNDNSLTSYIDGYQKVILLDSISNYKIELLQNIYKAYNYVEYYNKNSIITYNENKPLISVINSCRSISSDNNGINEFDVQKIDVTCSTPLVNGQIPLYVGTTIKLDAEIDDILKVYDKKITWSSEDESVATVDNTGKVTGRMVGKTNIKVLCDGIYEIFEVEVMEEIVIKDIESIVIKDDSGNRSDTIVGESDFAHHGIYGNNKTIKFSIEVNPSDAVYSSISWTLTASQVGRQYMTDANVQIETIEGVNTVEIHTTSGTGTSDDPAYLKCTVTGLNPNNIVETTFIINHKKDTTIPCVTAGTFIHMSDGTIKKVEDIKTGDQVLVFNHLTGQFDTSIVMYNAHDKEEWTDVDIINLLFDNGTTVKMVTEHAFFNLTLNEYSVFNYENVESFIGHEFFVLEDLNNINKSSAKLIDVYYTTEFTGVYSPVTANGLNCFTDGFLSIAGDFKGFYNIFEFDENQKYDEELMKQDIEKYGLYTYEDFKDYVPEVLFDAYQGQYLKVSIGKGHTTFEEILQLIDKYINDEKLPDDFVNMFPQ